RAGGSGAKATKNTKTTKPSLVIWLNRDQPHELRDLRDLCDLCAAAVGASRREGVSARFQRGSSFTALTRHRQKPAGTQRSGPPWIWIAIGPSVMPPMA